MLALHWDDFQSKLRTSWGELYETREFADVTLFSGFSQVNLFSEAYCHIFGEYSGGSTQGGARLLFPHPALSPEEDEPAEPAEPCHFLPWHQLRRPGQPRHLYVHRRG